MSRLLWRIFVITQTLVLCFPPPSQPLPSSPPYPPLQPGFEYFDRISFNITVQETVESFNQSYYRQQFATLTNLSFSRTSVDPVPGSLTLSIRLESPPQQTETIVQTLSGYTLSFLNATFPSGVLSYSPIENSIDVVRVSLYNTPFPPPSPAPGTEFVMSPAMPSPLPFSQPSNCIPTSYFSSEKIRLPLQFLSPPTQTRDTQLQLLNILQGRVSIRSITTYMFNATNMRMFYLPILCGIAVASLMWLSILICMGPVSQTNESRKKQICTCCKSLVSLICVLATASAIVSIVITLRDFDSVLCNLSEYIQDKMDGLKNLASPNVCVSETLRDIVYEWYTFYAQFQVWCTNLSNLLLQYQTFAFVILIPQGVAFMTTVFSLVFEYRACVKLSVVVMFLVQLATLFNLGIVCTFFELNHEIVVYIQDFAKDANRTTCTDTFTGGNGTYLCSSLSKCRDNPKRDLVGASFSNKTIEQWYGNEMEGVYLGGMSSGFHLKFKESYADSKVMGIMKLFYKASPQTFVSTANHKSELNNFIFPMLSYFGNVSLLQEKESHGYLSQSSLDYTFEKGMTLRALSCVLDSIQNVYQNVNAKRCADAHDMFTYLENAFSALSLHFLLFISANLVYIIFTFMSVWIFHRYQVVDHFKVIRMIPKSSKKNSRKKKETIPRI
jgi:hypothetical protein